MIVTGLLNIIYNILSAIFANFNIPKIDNIEDITYTIELIFDYGVSYIGFLFSWKVVKLCFFIIAAIIAAYYIYVLVMWILRKIPMLGIS